MAKTPKADGRRSGGRARGSPKDGRTTIIVTPASPVRVETRVPLEPEDVPDHTYSALGLEPPPHKVRTSPQDDPLSLTSDAVATDPSQVPAVPGAVFYILPPLDAGPPFGIGTTITICEAAMVYGGRHPHAGFLRDEDGEGAAPLADYEDFIRTSSTSWHAYCDLMRWAKDGSLKLARPFWLPDGRLDPRQTRIETDALYRLAQERGDAAPIVAKQCIAELAQCAAALAREAALAYAPDAADKRGAQRQCAQWLASLPATPPPLKDNVWAEAKRQPFGPRLSRRAFERAWGSNDTPDAWKKAGRKARLPG